MNGTRLGSGLDLAMGLGLLALVVLYLGFRLHGINRGRVFGRVERLEKRVTELEEVTPERAAAPVEERRGAEIEELLLSLEGYSRGLLERSTPDRGRSEHESTRAEGEEE